MGEDDANKGGSRRSKRADDGLHGTRRRSYSLALRPSPHCADAQVSKRTRPANFFPWLRR